MAKTNMELAHKLTTKGAALVPDTFKHNVKVWYAENAKTIIAIAGSEQKAALYVASAFAQVNMIPKLLECEPETFFNCLLNSMATGLIPGPAGECVYIPFGRTATFVPMVKGYAKLVLQGGFVTGTREHVVWDFERFELVYGDEEKIIHKPDLSVEIDERLHSRIGSYVIVRTIHGDLMRRFCPAREVLAAKARSRAAKAPDSPWNSKYIEDVDAMWTKTPYRRMAKRLPQSPELVKVQVLDNVADNPDLAESKKLLDTEVHEVMEQVLDAKYTSDTKE